MKRTITVTGSVLLSLFALVAVFLIGICYGVRLADRPSDQPIDQPVDQPVIALSPSAAPVAGAADTGGVQGTVNTVVLNGASTSGGGTLVDGVRYELPGSPCVVNVVGDGVELTSGRHTLTVSGGRLSVNGVSYGRVRPGGWVRVTTGGAIFVNGIERSPAQGQGAGQGGA